MPILEKIHNIQNTLEVEKTGYNERHEFAFYKEEDVLNAVKAKMNELGVIVKGSSVRYEHIAFYDSNGRYRPRANGDIEFTFIDIEDGSEYSMVVNCEGSATGDDVSTRKMWTQARKIALLTAFSITEDNPKFDGDAQGEQEPVNNASKPDEQPEVGPSANELVGEIGQFVNGENAAYTGQQVNALGTKFAEKLNVSTDPKVWRKDVNVLHEVVKALRAGEVE